MTPESFPSAPTPDPELLSRKEASRLLETFRIHLKPASLARIWSVGGNGPPAIHIGRRPFYPRAELIAWAQRQRTGLRASGRAPPAPGDAR